MFYCQKEGLIKKFLLFVLITLAALLAIMLLVSPPENQPQDLPEVFFQRETRVVGMPPDALQFVSSKLAEMTLEDPRVWSSAKQLVTPEYRPYAEEYVLLTQNNVDLCLRDRLDLPKKFPLSGYERVEPYAVEVKYQNHQKLLQLLIQLANQEIQEQNVEGIRYLRAAGNVVSYFYENPSQRELKVANQMCFVLGSYLLKDFPESLLDSKMLCWFPDEKIIRENIKSVQWDIFNSTSSILDNRARAYEVFASSDSMITFDYWISGTPWERASDKSALLAAYQLSEQLANGAFADHDLIFENYLGFSDFFRGNYIDQRVAQVAMDSFFYYLNSSGRVKALRDCLEIKVVLVARGLIRTPDNVEAIIDSHNLVNIFTGQPYTVSPKGEIILFPLPYKKMAAPYYFNGVPGMIEQ